MKSQVVTCVHGEPATIMSDGSIMCSCDRADTTCVACGAKECRTGYQRCWDCWEDWNGAYRERITDEEYRRRVAIRRQERESREAANLYETDIRPGYSL